MNAMRQFGHYQILHLLGEGGMGEVYLAEDSRLGRKVALKLLPARLTSDEDRVLRFQQEARTASALNHPNIITIFDIGETDSTHFIATEFVKGETLRSRMCAASFSLQEILEITVQVASALRAAHEVGVVHRDIKPENIMVRPDGIVKVLDFGLAKLTQRITTGGESEMGLMPLVNTEPGLLIGTPRYMSPEQVRGLDVDERTDIFSLGVVLYEMLTGRAPFEGPSIGDIIATILQQEPPSLASCSTAIPEGLQQIVSKALRKDRDERYQAIGDLISDLRSQEKTETGDRKLVLPVHSGNVPVMAATTEHVAVASRKDAGALSREKPEPAHATSSAEYVVGEIKQHKRGAAVILGLLLAAAAAAAYFSSSTPEGESAITSLAVLPFVNASGDPSMEYLSDGISESLINSLSRLSQLKVIARSSSFKYKGKEPDMQEVARSLGVRAIVLGRVEQRGDQLQVSAELVDTRDKTQMWGEQYNRKAADLQAVQEEIVRKISDNLRLRLTGTQEQQLGKRATANPQAYQFYLNGVFYGRKGGIENYRKALDYYNQAVALDPSFALAYTGIAAMYHGLQGGSVFDPREIKPKAKAAVQKALELDETLAEPHLALANIKRNEWDWPGTEIEFKRAIDLNPNLAGARGSYADYLSSIGRHTEALNEIKIAQELDPLWIAVRNTEGIILLNARRFDDAIRQFQSIIKLQPDFSEVYAYLGYAYDAKGMYAEAIAEYQKLIALEGESTSAQAYLGYAFAKSGKLNEARTLLKKLKTTKEYVSPAELAILYAGLGDKEEAFAALERAYAAHDLQMQYITVEPHYDSLRSDPRFTDLMRKVGFEP